MPIKKTRFSSKHGFGGGGDNISVFFRLFEMNMCKSRLERRKIPILGQNETKHEHQVFLIQTFQRHPPMAKPRVGPAKPHDACHPGLDVVEPVGRPLHRCHGALRVLVAPCAGQGCSCSGSHTLKRSLNQAQWSKWPQTKRVSQFSLTGRGEDEKNKWIWKLKQEKLTDYCFSA